MKDITSKIKNIYNINSEKMAVENVYIGMEIGKSTIGFEKSSITKQKNNEPTKDNITQVYDEIKTNQIFGTADVVSILKCSPSTARAIIAKLRDMVVVKEVKGKGKGKYRFLYEGE